MTRTFWLAFLFLAFPLSAETPPTVPLASPHGTVAPARLADPAPPDARAGSAVAGTAPPHGRADAPDVSLDPNADGAAWLDTPPPASPVGAGGLGDLLASFARTMLMLLVVLGLIYLTLHKGVGKLVQKNQEGKRMRVVERIGLDQRRTLYIIQVDGQEMLLGTGEGGMVHLRDLHVSSGTPTPKQEPARAFVDALSTTQAKRQQDEESAA